MGFNVVEFLESLYRPVADREPVENHVENHVGGPVENHVEGRQATPQAVGPDDLPLDWRIAWEERAAIREYDGGLSRERSETLALADILEQMKRNG
jgi:hypothetical protein